MKSSVLFGFALLMLLLFTGCVHVDYTGRSFPETPASREIKYFVSRKDMPAEGYTIIGRFELTAPDGSDGFTVEKALLEKARKHGGDAVCIVSSQMVNVGAYTANSDEFGAPETPGMAHARLHSANGSNGINSFGARYELKSEKMQKYELRVKALLFKNSADVEKIFK